MLIQRQLKNTKAPQLLGLAILSVLVLLYAPVVMFWVEGWIHKNTISTEHEYFSHGIIGLPFAAYISWTNRKKWRRLPDANNFLGAAFLLLGGVCYLSGVSEWVNLSLPMILTGLCLWFKGIAGLKLQGFPLLLVLLATPTAIPYLIAPYTLPLQSFIAGTVAFILTQFGINVTVDGINLYTGGRIVEVAPYCAGLKMMFTTLYVGLMLLYWTGVLSSRRNSLWFLVLAVLVSISSNILRNTLLTFFHGTGRDAAFHWLHEGWGGELYSSIMLLLLVPILNLIDKHFSETRIQVDPEREN
ncbi:cyanoexosortase B [Aetokthonos hydrillicola Thurmond2011]|jgi:cyanoexosortase B|uniref:Cyanoexosortase B n=1 Tax=Aetokthonos hydrillicola Thurmond2011 TaxID=2712845 RepID=A0AAP5ICD7_9CYAN|nr:cyanoexosortase B [Aetokthonos hydrillicola]MBO3462365.1 cyanoexosortase B [Aetokthonos hydrillicola CCALA 1050]MBW4584218.1 cyanoexosortase B [Aetokthonos hydrillicola CCALA 1050]MDR9898574.1 cyanoexosortase B [Aetokthonos hydrillicola Thurmond2011]